MNSQKMHWQIYLVILSFCVGQILCATQKSKPVLTIPFQLLGSYIVLPVKINHSPPLQFILDSGIQNTIITELHQDDTISLNYTCLKSLTGLGSSTQINALVSQHNLLNIDKLQFENKTVYVLQDSVFSLSRHSGFKINGLIGMDILNKYVVEINYHTKILRFYQSSGFIKPSDYSPLPLLIVGGKMFTQVKFLDQTGNLKSVNMLLDMGAELNAWFKEKLFNEGFISGNLIKTVIGEGLGGSITGKLTKIPELYLGEFMFKNPTISFLDTASVSDLQIDSNRGGTIGSQLLSRFNFIIHFCDSFLYIKPNQYFDRPFTYNISGVEIMQSSIGIPVYEISRVCVDSPGYQSGIEVGDVLLKLNGRPVYQYSLNEIRNILNTPSQNNIHLQMFHNGKTVTREINMTERLHHFDMN